MILVPLVIESILHLLDRLILVGVHRGPDVVHFRYVTQVVHVGPRKKAVTTQDYVH